MSVDRYVTRDGTRYRVDRPATASSSLLPYALVTPMLVIALAIIATKVKWIDGDRVREINDRATISGPLP